MSEQTDQALLAKAIEGDFLAFEELHARLAPPITRFVRRLIGQSQVEDVVQDTFLALYTNMERIRPDENIRPYVFRIARNRCYDILRQQGRYDTVSLDDEPASVRVSFDLAQRETPPDEVAHWLLLHLEVQEAMEQLPEAQRQALILYSEQQLAYPEIAAVLEVSVGTVKSRLFHARKTLRRLLRPETLAALTDELDEQPTNHSKEVQDGRGKTATVLPGAQGATEIDRTRPAHEDLHGGGADVGQELQRSP